VASTAGGVAELRGNVRLTDAHQSVEQHRLTTFYEPQCSEVAYQRRRQRRVVAEVEGLEDRLTLEARPAQALSERLGLAPAPGRLPGTVAGSRHREDLPAEGSQ
jgi:hypothetical protein